ncbi:MAG: hypothetical protein IJ733_19530, partial [Lachnospiraceae bacterium]|nr:hypothetical protein [Lachnospiraceae bacterium]
MVQKNYHITDFSDGSFENLLKEVASLSEYQSAAQILLMVLEQNWDTEEIKRKVHLIKKYIPKAEIVGISHYDESTWGVELKKKSVLNFLFFEEPAFTVLKIPMKVKTEEEIGRMLNK